MRPPFRCLHGSSATWAPHHAFFQALLSGTTRELQQTLFFALLAEDTPVGCSQMTNPLVTSQALVDVEA